MSCCCLHVELPLGPFAGLTKTRSKERFRVTPERLAEFRAKQENYAAYRREYRVAFETAFPYTVTHTNRPRG